MKGKKLYSAVVLAGGMACMAGASPVPYVTSLNGVLLTVDAANNSPTLIGPSGLATDSRAQDINGKLWAASASGGLYQVTGSGSTLIANLPFGNIGDLDCDANGIWGYSNAASMLFYYNLTSNSVTVQTPVPSLVGKTVTGVAIDAAGQMYLSTALNNELYKMFNPMVPIANFIGLMPTTDNNFGDIDFDPATGKLWGVTYNNRSWYTINTGNATTQLITPTTSGVLDITGLAIPVVAPEPATWAILGLGALAIVRRKR